MGRKKKTEKLLKKNTAELENELLNMKTEQIN